MSFDQVIDLKSAVKLHDIAKVHNILQENPELLGDPDSIELGFQLLIDAISYDNDDDKLVELLISFGADPNFNNLLDWTISNDSLKCTEVLLKNGAQLTGPKWQREESAIHVAFERHESQKDERKNMLLLFLQYGLDVNFCTKDGKNLLHLFARSVEINDKDGREIAQILLDLGIPLDEPCSSHKGYTPLMYAIESENIEFITFLIDKGSDTNFKSKNEGIFPLYVAVNDELDCGDIKEVLELLISRGAKIDAVTHSGRTVLHETCNQEFQENEESLNFLILQGADIRAKDKDDFTPFYFAYEKGYSDNTYQYMIIFIKEYAKQVSFDSSFDFELDGFLIKINPELQMYYEKCEQELTQMKSTQFYASNTYYSVLKMSKNIKKLALLTKNKEFVENFERQILLFPEYQNDLRWILNEAVKVRNEIQIVYTRLKSIFRYFFPDVVLRILAEHLNVNDLPLDLSDN